IRVSPPMVKQAPKRSATPGRRGITLLPPADGPKIGRSRAGEVDALLVVMPESAGSAGLEKLPESLRWRDLLARERPRAGAVRSTSLANRRQTLAVLGFLPAKPTHFEQLALAGRMMKEAATRGPRTISLATAGFAADGRGQASEDAALEALLAGALAQAFALPSCRAPSEAERHVTGIQLPVDARVDVPYAEIRAEGTNLARWLTALPPNILDSRGYRTAVTQLARRHGLEMTWLGEQALKRAGANAFLAVAAGNDSPVAGIAHLKYRPGRRRGASPDLALIGKGILFDTGGVNLKPHRSMLDMHTDMGGSAVALATLIALARLRAPIAADAWLAITENHIGPQAYRPQEVVRAANGVTIQVIHTDAEGRMVLADTLALAARTRPRLMLDFATLTGACIHSLTERMSGVFTNRPALAPVLLAAGRNSGERVWTFPFDSDFDSDLESKVADILQCSTEGKGDHILAARFLSRFVPDDIPWAHVDLSSATRTGGLGHINTEITGFGVRYALQLIVEESILRAVEQLK
ncbi:MAG: M17 family metallopeptidase, partial [Steroidobacteraceae bacterium]